ncbi:MAG: HigA family addiction module antidote protein [Candidatus Zixiibacteriota bacterium]|nr:MAG: HigA family addiction module antidote protein [candidate division Zixibacteria bacterium]
MEKRLLPEAFHPGEYIREEAEARGWSPSDLADILGYERNVISDILTGRRSVSPEMAKALGDAFGTGAQVWLNLQAAYKLATSSRKDTAVAKRAKLYEVAPVRVMLNRGWIEPSTNVDVLEAQVRQFLEIESIEDKIPFAYAARQSVDYRTKPNPSQTAWLMRARKLAQSWRVKGRYSGRSFNAVMRKLASLRAEPEEIRHVPRVLSEHGIRFLVIEYLPKSKIDGACFWLDEHSPVLALSLRWDRIDWFWHTLAHEMKHLRDRDGEKKPVLEIRLVGEDAQGVDEKPRKEKGADKFAVEFLVDQARLNGFVARKDPIYSKKDVMAFSKLVGVHPGIVVGQLQFRRIIPYSHFRSMLVKIRDIVTATALTDGWGKTVALRG